jgi:hypothetical protein
MKHYKGSRNQWSTAKSPAVSLQRKGLHGAAWQPFPDIRALSPAAGETITAKPPHFSWRAVDADVPLYYRIDIKDMVSGIRTS